MNKPAFMEIHIILTGCTKNVVSYFCDRILVFLYSFTPQMIPEISILVGSKSILEHLSASLYSNFYIR